MSKKRSEVVDKGGLCEALGWSRPKLDLRLKADRKFPVRSRGSQAGGWRFHLPTVQTYLAATPEMVRKPGRPPLTVSQQAAQERGAQHLGEATARQRRDEAQAAILEDKLRRERAELLEAEDVRTVVSTMLARFAKALDALPDELVKRLGLDETKVPAIRAVIDKVRVAAVHDLRKILTPAAPR